METVGKIEELHKKLTTHFNTVRLGVAGRLVYYDKVLNAFILAVHSTSPDDTRRAGDVALDSIRETILLKLEEAGIGFACRQI